MDTPVISAAQLGSRRNEDIALDLLKFIAAHTELGKATSVGFQQAAGSKGQDAVDKLLDLYGKCLAAVQGQRK